jgi:MFS transporter, FSR family, fosmidomycin resistance protein
MTRPFALRRKIHQTSAFPARTRLAGSGPILALLAATHTVDDLYQGAVPALLPFLAIERHYTYAGLTGITLAATFLSSAVQPAFGVLTDRRSLGWLTAAGLLVAGLGVGLSGLGNSYLITWLAVALSGVGVAAYHPETARTARGIAGDSTQAMSWFSVGGTAGVALAPLVVTPVLLVTGLRGTPLLALPAVLTASMLAIRRPWRRAQAAGRARLGQLAASDQGGGPASASGLADASGPTGASGLADASGPTGASGPSGASGAGGPTGTEVVRPRRDDWRSFARLTAAVSIRSMAYFGVASLLALFVIRRFHEPTAVGSAVLTAFLAAGAAGSLIGGWLADRWRRLATVRLGYTFSIPAILLLATAPDVAVAFCAAVALGLALFVPFAVQVTLGQDYLPNRIGTASGVTLGLALSIGGLATPLFGLLADSRGLTVTLAALAVLPAASLVLSGRLREPRDRGETAARG